MICERTVGSATGAKDAAELKFALFLDSSASVALAMFSTLSLRLCLESGRLLADSLRRFYLRDSRGEGDFSSSSSLIRSAIVVSFCSLFPSELFY